MPLNDLAQEGYTSFHIKLIDAKGKERHAFTRVGGGTILPEQLVQSFKDNRVFSKCKEISITPIEGDVFPGDFLEVTQRKPMVTEVVAPNIQIGDPITIEQFDKLGKFHVVTAEKERKDSDGALG